jgi:hypothetical protein
MPSGLVALVFFTLLRRQRTRFKHASNTLQTRFKHTNLSGHSCHQAWSPLSSSHSSVDNEHASNTLQTRFKHTNLSGHSCHQAWSPSSSSHSSVDDDRNAETDKRPNAHNSAPSGLVGIANEAADVASANGTTTLLFKNFKLYFISFIIWFFATRHQLVVSINNSFIKYILNIITSVHRFQDFTNFFQQIISCNKWNSAPSGLVGIANVASANGNANLLFWKFFFLELESILKFRYLSVLLKCTRILRRISEVEC